MSYVDPMFAKIYAHIFSNMKIGSVIASGNALSRFLQSNKSGSNDFYIKFDTKRANSHLLGKIKPIFESPKFSYILSSTHKARRR